MGELPLDWRTWGKRLWSEPISKIVVAVVVAFLLVGGGYKWAQKEVKIIEQKQVRKVATFAKTVGDLLAAEQIRLRDGDVVQPALTARLKDGMEITVFRGVPVAITVDGQTHYLTLVGENVADFLAAAGIKLGALDRVEPALDAPVTRNSGIRVYRGTEEIITVREELPFAEERQKDPKLARGEMRTLVAGVPGLVEKTIRIRYEDGQELGREEIASKVVKEPVTKVVRVGTRAPGGSVATSRGLVRYRERRVMEATAYTPNPKGGTGITKSGLPAKPGLVAVDPRVIPLGTRLYIPNYGFALAADIGSAIKGNRIDLCMSTRREALRFGRRKIEVYVLE